MPKILKKDHRFDSGDSPVWFRDKKPGHRDSCLVLLVDETTRHKKNPGGPPNDHQFYQFHQFHRWGAFSVILAAFLATWGL